MASGLLPLLAALLLTPIGAPPPQTVEQGYTVWKDVGEARWPATLKKRALLIGNGSYDPRPPGGHTPPPDPLRNLGNPCVDVRAVAKSLVMAGWKSEEVAVACDQPSGSIYNGLTSLYDSLPADATEDQITLVYLSGHGMQVGLNGYFFGINARPDFDAAAERLQAGPGVRVFANESLDPLQFFRSQFGGYRTRRPILLVIDACRSDPVFDRIRKALLHRSASLTAAEQVRITAEVKSITAPSGGGVTAPTGMVVLFGSTFGHVVDDDDGVTGHSRLAAAFANALSTMANGGMNAVISKTVDDIEDEVRGMPDEASLYPERLGGLEGDPCVNTCGRAVTQPATIRADAPPSLLRTSYSQDAASPSSAAASAAMMSAQPGPKPPTSALEVFWCAVGDDGDDTRRLKAQTLASAVRSVQRDGSLSDLSVRVSRLSKAENSKPGFQVSEDALRYDVRDEIGAYAVQRLAPQIKSERGYTGTPNYLSAFYCNGSYHGGSDPSVYVQVPDASLLNVSSKIIDGLRSSERHLNIIPETEVREISPDHTEVRYFDPNKRDDARSLSKSLSELTGVPVVAKYMPKPHSLRAKNQLEVWIGKTDGEAVKAHFLKPVAR